MNEVWMLDFIHGVFPRWGVFVSERAAWDWVEEHDPENKSRYTPFRLTVNTELDYQVKTTAPQRSYVRQM